MKRLTVLFLLLAAGRLAQAACPGGQLHCTTFTWNYSQGAELAVGFNMYRLVPTPGTPATCPALTTPHPTPLAQIPVAVLTYVDLTVTPGVSWCYYLTAYNPQGESSSVSPPGKPLTTPFSGPPTAVPGGLSAVTQ